MLSEVVLFEQVLWDLERLQHLVLVDLLHVTFIERKDTDDLVVLINCVVESNLTVGNRPLARHDVMRLQKRRVQDLDFNVGAGLLVVDVDEGLVDYLGAFHLQVVLFAGLAFFFDDPLDGNLNVIVVELECTVAVLDWEEA